MTLPLLSLILGALLGHRFRVLVLIPAMFSVSVAATAVGIAAAHGLWATIGLAAISLAGVQLGFLSGAAIRYYWTENRPNNLPPTFSSRPSLVGARRQKAAFGA